MSSNSERVLLILEKIKKFTQEVPASKGSVDPSYKIYLSKCCKLSKLDDELTDVLNLEYLTSNELEDALLDIERQVDEVIG